jgi:hypothetical protein
MKAKDTENFDHLFTPERIAHLDRICAEIDAGGKMYSIEEVEEHLNTIRREWLERRGKSAKRIVSRKTLPNRR